jgi:mannose-1-phosphate guanylyltransferase
MKIGSANQKRWAVILAGGEGVRLRSLTRLVSGDDTPKQFCPLLSGRTLLAQTKQRIARSISSDRTIYVLLASHERFYKNELRTVAPDCMLVQPFNRGTLPAILLSLIRIAREDEDAVVGFFPSDHHYSEEHRFMSGVDLAFIAAGEDRDSVTLLGVAAKNPEVDYGWIEAEATGSARSRNGLLRVKRFWEKPSPRVAQDLLEQGCVWNTFVMIGRAQAFLNIIQIGAPQIYQEFEPIMEAPERSFDNAALKDIYQQIPTADFSHLVLSAAPEKLGVLCLGDVGWSDLGDPSRVIKMLSETGAQNEWLNRWQERSAVVAVAGN